MTYLDDRFEYERHRRSQYPNTIVPYGSTALHTIPNLQPLDAKVILAEKTPEALLVLIDKENERQYQKDINSGLEASAIKFAEIYSIRASQGEFDKVYGIDANLTPAETSIWGYTTKGQGISITLKKR